MFLLGRFDSAVLKKEKPMNGQLRGLVLFALITSIGPQAFAADGQEAGTGRQETGGRGQARR